jgi:cobalt transporter subunit CbtB
MNQQTVFVQPALRAKAVSAAALALLFGVFVLAGVGFAGPSVIHNAAHDSRHSFAFPCH